MKTAQKISKQKGSAETLVFSAGDLKRFKKQNKLSEKKWTFYLTYCVAIAIN